MHLNKLATKHQSEYDVSKSYQSISPVRFVASVINKPNYKSKLAK